MKPIDFAKEFKRHLQKWCEANNTINETAEDIIDKELEEYENWLKTPQPWLNGKTPDTYFDDIKDANKATLLLTQYIIKGMAVPEPLENRIIELKETLYPAFLYVLQNFGQGVKKEISDKLKEKIIEYIAVMQKPHPYKLYINWINNAKKSGSLTEKAAEMLLNAADIEKENIIKAYLTAKNEYASDVFLDILSNCAGDVRIVKFTIEKFINSKDKKAFYANCLGKLGDGGAISYLYEAIGDKTLGYYDYTAIKYAIEELGGTVDNERDFTGDNDFEKLKDI